MSMSRLFLRVSSSKMALSDSSRSSVKRQDASPQSCMHSTRRLLDSPANRRESAGYPTPAVTKPALKSRTNAWAPAWTSLKSEPNGLKLNPCLKRRTASSGPLH